MATSEIAFPKTEVKDQKKDTTMCQQIECDKVIIVDGDEFPVNSSVLATHSSFFKSMFTIGMKEINEARVTLKHPQINSNGFSDWLTEINSPGSVEFTTENILDVWAVANFAQSERVLNHCKSTILSLLCNSDSSLKEFGITVYSLAYLFDDTNIELKTRQFVTDNLAEALHNIEFQNAIGAQKLLKILKERSLIVMSEEKLFLGIMEWVKFNTSAREHFLVDILKLVYLHEVPAATLKENLYRGKFMMDRQFLELYFDAIDKIKGKWS